MLLKTVVEGVTPEGSGSLAFGPKNHSKVGEGVMEGRGKSITVAEHVREKISPAVLELERALMVTFSVPKFTVKTNNNYQT